MASEKASSEHLVAIYQGVEKVGDVQDNLCKMKEQIEHASRKGAELVVFPELYVSGYTLSHEEAKRLAVDKAGDYYKELSAAAKAANIAVLYGYPEVDRYTEITCYYNSAQLIDKDGSLLVNFRKLHLWTHGCTNTEAVYTPGQSFADIVECCGMKIGILICYDVELSEPAKLLALKGAEVILVPTALHISRQEKVNKKVPTIMLPTRALENNVYIVYANYAGGEYGGQSVCCDPSGDLVVHAGNEETLLFATIDTQACKMFFSRLTSRRPEIYRL